MKTKVYLKYFVHSWTMVFFASNKKGYFFIRWPNKQMSVVIYII